MAINPFKRRFLTPGYAGGTLEDQLATAREWDVNGGYGGGPLQSPNDQILTPQNQEVITRPRTVTPSFRDAFNRKPPVVENEPTFDGKPILAEQVNGEPFGTRDRRTQPRDYVADGAQYVRDLQNQPRNWKDKTLDVIDAASTGLGNKPRTTMSKRERELAKAQDQLGMNIALEKQAQNDLVPVTLNDGTVVQAPARNAGTLQSQQQRIRLTAEQATERKRMNSGRMANWNAMSADRRQRLIADLYRSGGLNDPELLEYAADQLGIPGTLREKFVAGQMRDAVDENGNLVQVDRQTQEVLPTGAKSYEVTKEVGRNRRAQMTQEGQDRRKAMTPPRTGRAPTADKTAQRRAATLIGQIDWARRELQLADEALGKKPDDATAQQARRNAQSVGEQSASELNALNTGYEAGPGDKGYPYYKQKEGGQSQQGGKYAGRRIPQANIPKFAERHGMTPEEAIQFLKSEGAVIY